MSDSDQYFHFTLGPVQSFVAQARRTRDFWAGSFLLSWLSAVAIKAVEKQGGELMFPKVDENYLAWLENKGIGDPPQQGCIPNRFKGGLAKVPEKFDPSLVIESIDQAWQGLAEAVWKHDLKDFIEAKNKQLELAKKQTLKTREIWQRQVKSFWEINWVLTDDKSTSNLLDRRKNWRNYLPPEEAGVKCMMMGGWQELSGTDSPNAKDLEAFWSALRQQKGKSASLANDLREKEYLCAIGFIKRRFAYCFDDFKQLIASKESEKNPPIAWTVHGWKVSPAVPSVSYIAAAPWLAKVLEKGTEKALQQFHQEAKKLTFAYGERHTYIECIENVLKKNQSDLDFWSLKSLDGDIFFDFMLDNKNRHKDQIQAQKVKRALIALTQSVDNLKPVSPFYALLMMDGDSLGIQMSVERKQTAISASLNAFTEGVNARVQACSGFLIYAGGDDVLALLPLEYALTCADELRQFYLKCFEKHGEYTDEKNQPQRVSSTLSGAIEYAHIKMPLGKILADAHDLLDNVAKDKTGRDAIAVRVWKPGGQHLQWAMPWHEVIQDNQVLLDKIVNDFRTLEEETPFSNAFFFNIEKLFSVLQQSKTGDKPALTEGFREPEIITDLVAAEFLTSGVNQQREAKGKLSLKQAKEHVRPLVELCMPIKREVDDKGQERFIQLHQLNMQAAHLIQFLVKKGVEHG